MKADLCTWTKNGAKTLIPVLKRIDDVIPIEEVREKIAVDDSSVDSTVKILKEFNWKVYPNRSGFINGGTTEALRHVRSKFFVFVEQDVLLCRNWWDIIPKNMEDKTVAVSQGVEISTNRAERGIDKYNFKKIRQMPLEKGRDCGKPLEITFIVQKLLEIWASLKIQSPLRCFIGKLLPMALNRLRTLM